MFRSRRRLPRPVLCSLCSGGPLGPRPSQIPAALPARTRPIPQQERLSLPLVTSHQSHITNSFTIRTYEKRTRNPFRIRTSKTQHLKSFRIRTYKKRGEGGHIFQTKGFRLRVSIFEVRYLSLTTHRPLLTFHFCYPYCSSKEPHAVAAAESDPQHRLLQAHPLVPIPSAPRTYLFLGRTPRGLVRRDHGAHAPVHRKIHFRRPVFHARRHRGSPP